MSNATSELDPSPNDESPSDVSATLKNSRWSLVARLAIAGGALLSVVVLSIALQVEDFGRFSGVAALVAILGGLSRMGASELMLESLARQPEQLRSAYGRAIGTTIGAAAIGVIAIIALRPILLPDLPALFVVSLAIGEFLHVAALDLGMRLLNARAEFRRAGLQAVISMIVRLGAIATILVWPPASLTDIGLRYLAAGVAVWGIGLAAVVPKVGWPRLSFPTTFDEVRRGGTIAVGQTSLTVSTRIDQTLLVRAGLDVDAGIYSLGARVVFNSMMPAQALLEVVYPDFFRAGAEGGGSAHALARKFAKPLLIYGLFAAAVLIAVAPIVEALLDVDFDGVAWVIVAMAGFPTIRICQSLAGDILTGLGAHNIRSRATIAASVFNIALNLVLIPSLGWKGAAISTYAADGLLLALFVYSASRRRQL